MSEGQAPRVTAVVPAYKSAAFIGATLDSLAAQTWQNLEILVGDDASPDDTAEVLRAFAAQHPNVRVVERSRNLGWIANTNDLMAQATGAFIFYMPHDDVIEPTYVERLVGALIERPEAIIAYSDVTAGRLGEAAVVRGFDALGGVPSAIIRAMRMMRFPENWWVPHRGIFRAPAFRRIGGLRPAPFVGQFSADYPWLFQMALLGEFVRVPEVLYRKVYMPESLSRNWKGGSDGRRALLLSATIGTFGMDIGAGRKAAVLSLLSGFIIAREIWRLPTNLRLLAGCSPRTSRS